MEKLAIYLYIAKKTWHSQGSILGTGDTDMPDIKIKLYYLLIIVIAFMVLIIIYSKTNENIGNKREVNAFKGMLICFMIYTCVDLRLLFDDFYTLLPRVVVLFIMGTGFLAMSGACYFWLAYVLSGSAYKSKNVAMIFAQVPMAIVAMLVYSPLYTVVYEVTDVPTFKPALMLVVFLDYIYLICATVISIRKYFREKHKLERGRYLAQIFYILFYTVSGWVMGYFLNIPTIELCMVPVVLKLFIDLQDSRIYTDALTKLDNRRRISEYIDKELLTCSVEKPLTLIMIDIDFFKSVNDVLGHDVGDEVLVSFSKALSNLTSSKYARAARWGGDEFIVAGKEAGLVDDFRERLTQELEKESNLKFIPMFSVGSYTCISSEISVKRALAVADAELYKDKAEQHRNESQFQSMLKSLKQK